MSPKVMKNKKETKETKKKGRPLGPKYFTCTDCDIKMLYKNRKAHLNSKTHNKSLELGKPYRRQKRIEYTPEEKEILKVQAKRKYQKRNIRLSIKAKKEKLDKIQNEINDLENRLQVLNNTNSPSLRDVVKKV